MNTWSPADPIADDLARGRSAFARAVRTGDRVAIGDAYADDATLVAPAAEVIRGRSAIEQFWRTGVETGIELLELTVIELQQRGDVALEIGRYALHVVPESGGPVIDRGRYLVVHRADGDGRWRRCAEMFSPDHLPIPEPADQGGRP